MRHDDLDRFSDDPVVRALQAPGSATELAGIEGVLTEFRAAASRPRRRAIWHAGTGATLAVAAVALTGGVAAAAYTSTLPSPLQSAVHGVFGSLGVPSGDDARRPAVLVLPGHPARRAPHHLQAGSAQRGSSTAATTGHSPAGVAPAAAPAAAPKPQGAPAAAVAPTTAAPASSPPPSPSSSATPPLQPASLSAAASRTRVPVGEGVAMRGRLLAADGSPVPNHRVYLLERPAGAQQWQQVASGRTGSDGSITLRTPTLARNVQVRLVTPQGLASSSTSIVVIPKVRIATSRTADGRHIVVKVTLTGAESGDTVALARHASSGWTRVSAKQLGSGRTITFTVPVPTSQVHYRVRLVATPAHADGYGFFTAAPSG
jgi:hypothetical protein